MNCRNCGASMVYGQTICSNCDTDNSSFINNNQQVNQNQYNYQTNNSQNVGNYYNASYGQQYNAYVNCEAYNNDDGSSVDLIPNKKRQNIILRIASVISLIAGIGLLILSSGNLFVLVRMGRFNYGYLIGILISIIYIFSAFLISNFNLGKNKLFDNKVVFIFVLIINLLFGLVYRIFLTVFLFSLVGFIISLKRSGNNETRRS